MIFKTKNVSMSSRKFVYVPILIFLMKKSKFFGGIGRGLKKSFLFNDVKSPKLHLWQSICQNDSGCLANFCRNVPFCRPYWPWNYFSHIFAFGFILSFFDLLNIEIVSIFGHLGGSNKNNLWPPGKNWKNNLNMLYTISKLSFERCL